MPELSPDQKLLKRAEALTELDRWEEAIPLFSRFLSRTPDSHRAVCFLSLCFYETKDNKQAIKYVEDAIRLKPDHEWGHRLRSLYLSHTNLTEALAAAKEAVRLSPTGAFPLRRLMHAFHDCGNLDQALETGEKLRALKPDEEFSYLTMGRIFIEQGKLKEARELFLQALKINPLCASALNNLGTICLLEKDKDRAVEFFQQAIQLNPLDKTAQNNLRSATKLTVPWGVIVAATAAGFFVHPLAFIAAAFLSWVKFTEIRRLRKLSTPMQTFLKQKANPSHSLRESFGYLMNAEVTLPVVKVLFFIIIGLSIFGAGEIAFIGNSLGKSTLDSVFLFVKDLAILLVVALPFGLLWLFLAVRDKRANEK